MVYLEPSVFYKLWRLPEDTSFRSKTIQFYVGIRNCQVSTPHNFWHSISRASLIKNILFAQNTFWHKAFGGKFIWFQCNYFADVLGKTTNNVPFIKLKAYVFSQKYDIFFGYSQRLVCQVTLNWV